MTRTGRVLSPAGQAYWHRLHLLRVTDGRGHFDAQRAKAIKAEQALIARQPRTPALEAYNSAKQQAGWQKVAQKAASGDMQAKALLGAHRKAIAPPTPVKPNALPVGNNWLSRTLVGLGNAAIYSAEHPLGAAKQVAKSMNPVAVAKETGRDLAHGNIPGAAWSAMGILPFGRAAKAVKVLGDVAKAEKATEGSDAIAKLVAAMPEARKAASERRMIVREERGRRIAYQEPEFEKAGGGAAGAQAAMAAMKGEITGPRFEALQSLTPQEWDTLYNAVYKHPNLDRFERMQLWQALNQARNGEPLVKSQIDLVHRAFAPELLPARRGMLRRVGSVLNLPREIMSTLDASFGLRQALPLAVSHPKLWAREYGKSFKYLGMLGGGERRYTRDMRAIQEDPLFQEAVDAGMQATDITGGIRHREEAFMSPLAEKLTGGKYGPVRASARAYTGAQNLMRLSYYKYLKQKALRQGFKDTEQLQRSIAGLVNAHTGRGALPGSWERAGPGLSTVFYSPRLFASRIQTVADAMRPGVHPFVRREAQKTLAKLIAGVGGPVAALKLLGAATVVTDPRNADFGKVKFGNFRIDPWGGFQQPVRAAAQIGSGKMISSTTGKTLTLSGGYHASRYDVLRRFLEQKLSPQAQILVDALKGQDVTGQKFTPKQEAYTHLTPLSIQDAISAGQDKGPLAGVGAFGLSATGVGVQDYKNKSKQVGQPSSSVQKWAKKYGLKTYSGSQLAGYAGLPRFSPSDVPSWPGGTTGSGRPPHHSALQPRDKAGRFVRPGPPPASMGSRSGSKLPSWAAWAAEAP